MATKSFKAKIVSLILKNTAKRRYNKKEEKLIKEFENEKASGEKQYILPSFKTDNNIEKETYKNIDIYIYNKNTKTNKTIFYFHGGGYVHRPQISHWKFLNKLASNLDIKIIVPIYPLAPFHKFNEMYDIMIPYYLKYINDNPNDEIIYMGDSAGGGFALSFYEYMIENNYQLPNKTIVFSPWVDLNTNNKEIRNYEKKDAMLTVRSTKLWGKLWAGNDLNNYLVSPTFYNHLDELNNVYIFLGTYEIFYPDVLMFYEKIKNNQHCNLYIGDKMNHVYPLYPIPEAKKAMEIIVKIIKEYKEC